MRGGTPGSCCLAHPPLEAAAEGASSEGREAEGLGAGPGCMGHRGPAWPEATPGPSPAPGAEVLQVRSARSERGLPTSREPDRVEKLAVTESTISATFAWGISRAWSPNMSPWLSGEMNTRLLVDKRAVEVGAHKPRHEGTRDIGGRRAKRWCVRRETRPGGVPVSEEGHQWNGGTEEQRRSRRFRQTVQPEGGERCSLRAAPRRRLTASGVSRVGTCAS